MRKKQKQKIVLPPELPPEVPDDEIQVSDEDLQFVDQNRDYAGFVSNLDTKSITKHVTRVADVKDDALESMYERRLRKKSADKDKEEDEVEVDPVDALPVKTLDGKLYYRTVPSAAKKSETEATAASEDNGTATPMVKLTKAEKRAKQKKLRKEAKKQVKETAQSDEVRQAPQSEVLDEVKKELTAEEANEKKKYRLAELGTALLVDPESNIKSLREMLQIAKDGDHSIVILGLKSLLAVFKDILPGYRIRLPTEKEQQMLVSKAVKKTRLYESTLLTAYKAFVQKLIALEEQAVYKRVAMRCICTLLEAVPHFNFRDNLLVAVVKGISSQDDVVRKLCCATVKSLFEHEGKHGGEATVEAVKMIAELVKVHNCQLHPDSIDVFMSLSFDEDLGKPESSEVDNKTKMKNSKKKRKLVEPNKLPASENKRSRQEIISKTREEVKADYKAASFAQDVAERRRMQSDTLSAVFQTFFRILKHAMQSLASSMGESFSLPLLAPCLNGIGKFSHIIDLDFMADLMNYLRKLAGAGSQKNDSHHLTVSERLQCCIVAFKVMKNNLEALNVDLQEFFVQLYGLILEYRPGRDKGEVLAEALKIMLCDDRQHDTQRAAAFVKRLATFSLSFGSAESMAALVTLRHLLHKNAKCRNLLENDAGGGSVSGGIAKYNPYATDPGLSGALASVLWELNLLTKHYHPAVSTMASSISTMNTVGNQVSHSNISPQQAFVQLSHEHESFIPASNTKKTSNKRKKGCRLSFPISSASKDELMTLADENAVRNKLSEHFLILDNIVENERLRTELYCTNMSLKLCEQYRKQKKRIR
ncbi:nucleolar complex-associated protein 3 isoform X1 [Coffea arabica]|uniref:Nucleolar complex protein 3 homolog isoform X1 n=1 Tax=Coffea arabica TaxID=13443 RepID=A0A6P6SEI0_COFAR|nr:nucleolar complex protein 3 homolog isoform X1 [Coffea arabica]XP_027063918.1 nucleolar complex protein 3 homolog isoform X1 [Coffea arabica]